MREQKLRLPNDTLQAVNSNVHKSRDIICKRGKFEFGIRMSNGNVN